MRKQVCWLHISDIHFRVKSKLDQDDAFQQIRTDLAKRKADGTGLDLIFVTGDIAHSGNPKEFDAMHDRLARLCEDSDLSRERVFFCPGNHDSDRAISPVLLQGCWGAWQGLSEFQAFLGTAEYTALAERQGSYRQFVRRFRGDDAGFDQHQLHAFGRLTLDDAVIGVSSINSALLADGGPADRERMQVCARLLEASCPDRDAFHLVFALIHHPFEWLAPFEADRAETLIREFADVVLRGHLHQPKLVGSRRGGIISAAGAVWEASAGDYEYSVGTVSFETLLCDIQTIRFVQQTSAWMSSQARAPVPRDRDADLSPALIRAALGDTLTFPSQLAGVLSGYTSELLMTESGSANYFSTERIVIQGLSPTRPAPSALGVIRTGNLLTFYGAKRLQFVLDAQMPLLSEYDRALQEVSTTDAGMAALIHAREAAAEKLISGARETSGGWSVALLARVVAEGNLAQLAALADQGSSALLGRVMDSLASGARDPFEAWLAAGGPEFEFGELALIATRLAVRATADLAQRALVDAARRFPVEARRLDSVAKIIASELSDGDVYNRFRKGVERG